LADYRVTASDAEAAKRRHSFSIDPPDLVRTIPLIGVRPDRADSGRGPIAVPRHFRPLHSLRLIAVVGGLRRPVLFVELSFPPRA
jgi:hypothetical protein